jgi:REP element-mobilizing transposase RayT
MKMNKKTKKIPHKRRIISWKDPLHVVLKTHLRVSLEGYHTFLFLQNLIREIEKRYLVYIFQFSIQKSHIHLFLIGRITSNIPEGMKFLASKLARYFNKLFGRKGTFWMDRYFSSGKKTAKEIIRAIHYLANQNKYKSPFENISSSIAQERAYPWGIPPVITGN